MLFTNTSWRHWPHPLRRKYLKFRRRNDVENLSCRWRRNLRRCFYVQSTTSFGLGEQRRRIDVESTSSRGSTLFRQLFDVETTSSAHRVGMCTEHKSFTGRKTQVENLKKNFRKNMRHKKRPKFCVYVYKGASHLWNIFNYLGLVHRSN